jgi:hypothetical protein
MVNGLAQDLLPTRGKTVTEGMRRKTEALLVSIDPHGAVTIGGLRMITGRLPHHRLVIDGPIGVMASIVGQAIFLHHLVRVATRCRTYLATELTGSIVDAVLQRAATSTFRATQMAHDDQGNQMTGKDAVLGILVTRGTALQTIDPQIETERIVTVITDLAIQETSAETEETVERGLGAQTEGIGIATTGTTISIGGVRHGEARTLSHDHVGVMRPRSDGGPGSMFIRLICFIHRTTASKVKNTGAKYLRPSAGSLQHFTGVLLLRL